MSADTALRALLDETRALRSDLRSFVLRQVAILDAEIFETFSGAVPPAGGGVQTDGAPQTGAGGWTAQTPAIEIITGLVVILPLGATLATLTLGELTIPVQTTTFILSPVLFKVRNPNRSITYTAPANATIGSLVIAFGYAAPQQSHRVGQA